MKVIPTALLLSSGGIARSQDAPPTPVLISTSGADASSSDPVPTQITFDPDATPPIPELIDETDFPVP